MLAAAQPLIGYRLGMSVKRVDHHDDGHTRKERRQPAGRRVRGLQEARQEGEGGGGTALVFVLKLASL